MLNIARGASNTGNLPRWFLWTAAAAEAATAAVATVCWQASRALTTLFPAATAEATAAATRPTSPPQQASTASVRTRWAWLTILGAPSTGRTAAWRPTPSGNGTWSSWRTSRNDGALACILCHLVDPEWMPLFSPAWTWSLSLVPVRVPVRWFATNITRSLARRLLVAVAPTHRRLLVHVWILSWNVIAFWPLEWWGEREWGLACGLEGVLVESCQLSGAGLWGAGAVASGQGDQNNSSLPRTDTAVSCTMPILGRSVTVPTPKFGLVLVLFYRCSLAVRFGMLFR